MSWSDLIATSLVGVGLAMDCFAVAIGSGMLGRSLTHKDFLRASVFFGVFQGGMLALGWVAAFSVDEYISSVDHWIAFALLGFVGTRAIWGTLRNDGTDDGAVDVGRMGNLLLLSLATSIDAMAVGLGLALVDSNLAVTSLVVGVLTFLIALAGFYLGQSTGSMLGKPARLLGGAILIGIGLKILVSHLSESGV
ncbi:MAG: manganese efflux pump [Chloroflexi bacterium]|nr:manganese efflux pump [Chloroflexota bacterium]